MLVDTHCHLDFPQFDADRDEVIRNARQGGIGYMVNTASSLKSSQNSVELAAKYDFIYSTVGIHPHEADSVTKEDIEGIRKLGQNKKVVAVGEIGLDFYKDYSRPANQLLLFKSLLGLAKDLNLPVVIHTREAGNETLRILKEVMPLRAVVHCFSGDEALLKQCLDSGFYISFTCNITYKKAQNLRDIVKLSSSDKLLLETDCPYLSPEGMRGKRNTPLSVKVLAEEVARIKGLSFEQVAQATTDNAFKFFNLK
ncbi:MAG: TatD family hydrolase [Candidatus Omnitrophota bacterium]|jgi:TatD DNase family protein